MVDRAAMVDRADDTVFFGKGDARCPMPAPADPAHEHAFGINVRAGFCPVENSRKDALRPDIAFDR